MKKFSILISILMMVSLSACDINLSPGTDPNLFDKTPTLFSTIQELQPSATDTETVQATVKSANLETMAWYIPGGGEYEWAGQFHMDGSPDTILYQGPAAAFINFQIPIGNATGVYLCTVPPDNNGDGVFSQNDELVYGGQDHYSEYMDPENELDLNTTTWPVAYLMSPSVGAKEALIGSDGKQIPLGMVDQGYLLRCLTYVMGGYGGFEPLSIPDPSALASGGFVEVSPGFYELKTGGNTEVDDVTYNEVPLSVTPIPTSTTQ